MSRVGRSVHRFNIVYGLVVWGFCITPAVAEDFLLRLSAGGGYGLGSNSGTYDVDHGTLDLQSVTGGSGPVVTANLWADHIVFSDLSVGVEFLRLVNGATAALDLPHGISILTDPSGGQARLSASAEMGFLDVAFRPDLTDPRFAFFVGGGIGGGVGKASATLELYNPVLGEFGQHASVNSAIGGLHGLLGIDFYVTRSLFISVSPQLLYLTGHPVGVHQSYIDMMVTSSVGYSF